LKNQDVPVCQTRQSSFQLMCSAKIYSTELSSAKSDNPVFETGGSKISKTSEKSRETMMANLDDWRTPLVHYLENPNHITDTKVR
jgi:hypothetical protein